MFLSRYNQGKEVLILELVEHMVGLRMSSGGCLRSYQERAIDRL